MRLVRRVKMKIQARIKQLVNYGIKAELLTKEDRIYTTNLLLDLLKVTEYEDLEVEEAELEDILKDMLDYAFEQKIIDDNGVVTRDLFDTRIMNCLMPRPSQVIKTFNVYYKESPKKATDYFYKLSQDSDYIRRYRIKKDLKWVTNTEYGDLDITINLSKPEKDPRAIAAAKNAKASSYPKCLLCKENEGFAGNLNHPAR